MRTGTVRLFALTVLAAALSLALASPAVAAPKATEAAFTNPVAYELKSLLSTRFYCTVDTAGTWAVLDVFSADGIVKTVYSGPIAAANTKTYFPAWDGKDYLGRRLPSASYEWRLTLSKGGQSSVTRGKITVSRITFFVKGEGSTEGMDLQNRYMLPGNANIYLDLAALGTDGATLSINIAYPTNPAGWDPSFPTLQLIELGDLQASAGAPLKQTIYLRGSQAPRYRGSYEFQNWFGSARFYVTVIQ